LILEEIIWQGEGKGEEEEESENREVDSGFGKLPLFLNLRYS